MEEKLLKQFLKQEMKEEAERIKEKVRLDSSVADVDAPDSLGEGLAKLIEEYEAGKNCDTDTKTKHTEEIAGEIGISMEDFHEKVPREEWEAYLEWKDAQKNTSQKSDGVSGGRKHWTSKNRKVVLLVAAVLVLVLGLQLTSFGGTPYWMKVADLLLGNENTVTVDTEGGDRKFTTEVSEKEAYEKIKEELGIEPVQMQYMPENMKYFNFYIEDVLNEAKVFYVQKDGQILQYEIYFPSDNASKTMNIEDEQEADYTITVDSVEIKVREMVIKGRKEYMASFEYNNVFYRMTGQMEKGEFEKILKNLFFF